MGGVAGAYSGGGRRASPKMQALRRNRKRCDPEPEPRPQPQRRSGKTRSLYCSADFGVNLSWRIWRFTINLTPAVHWNFMDNFHIYSSTDEGGHAQDASVPMHFTMNFGLGFLF